MPSPHPQDRTGHLISESNPPQFLPFYQAVGLAITTWQQVETALCGAFVRVSTCQNEEVASAIFYSFRDFSDKLTLVNCAARLSLAGTKELIEWEGDKKKTGGLRKALRDAMELRNTVAHFHMVGQIPGGTPGPTVTLTLLTLSEDGIVVKGDATALPPPPPGFGLLLQPNSEDPNQQFNSNRAQTKKPMSTRDIMAARSRFSTLIRELKAFAAKLRKPPQE